MLVMEFFQFIWFIYGCSLIGSPDSDGCWDENKMNVIAVIIFLFYGLLKMLILCIIIYVLIKINMKPQGTPVRYL